MKKEYIHIDSSTALYQTSQALLEHIVNIGAASHVIILCIGTDRSTGDSLGPLVGHKLKDLNYWDVKVLGDLENPVHAKNLDAALEGIRRDYPNPFIIAVDASLGRMDHVGYITVGEGPLKPGSGLDKNLPEVGNMHITGIVNFGGFMDFVVLQNTRLSTVMKMAETISTGIRYAMWKYHRFPYTNQAQEYVQ